MAKSNWTAEQVKQLEDFRKEGLTAGEIAAKLNKTLKAVQVKIGIIERDKSAGEIKTLCKIATALGLSYGELISRVDNKKPLVEPKPAEVVKIKAELPEVVIEAIGAEMTRLEVRVADDLKAIESKEAEINLLKEANARRLGAMKELEGFLNDNC